MQEDNSSFEDNRSECSRNWENKTAGDDLVVNFSQTNPKTKEEAKLETHNRFIDIQIPLSGVEVMGYTPREDLPEAEYNADKDISFYHGLAESYIPVKPGMFVIFFPQTRMLRGSHRMA